MKKFFLMWLILPCCTLWMANGQTYEEYINSSFDYLDKNELAAAEESLKSAMRLEPGNPNNYALLTNLGTIQRQLGKTDEAITSYTAALSRYPKNTSILASRASLYAETGETEKAVTDYTLLLLEHPADEDALYNRGILYLQQKDFLRAEQDFDKMLEVNDKTVYGRLGHAILEKMRGNYADSERIYNYLIDKLPDDLFLYESRADLYFLMGKNARAMADIDKVFFHNKSPKASMYVLRGKINLARYEREAAIKDFEKAKEMGYDAGVINDLLKLAK